MKRDYRDEFRRWKEAELIDADLKAELKVMEGDEALMEDIVCNVYEIDDESAYNAHNLK